jgi:hypothetical protein
LHPYRIAGWILGVFAILFLAFVAIGILLPARWEADRALEIEAPPDTVFSFVDGAGKWLDWTPNLESGSELFGPEQGVGSGRRWDDENYGKGEFVITESLPPRELRYHVDVEGGSIKIDGRIQLEPTPSGTRVTWREEGDFGWNPILGYLAGRMNSLQGAQLEASLASLKDAAEAAVRSPPA